MIRVMGRYLGGRAEEIDEFDTQAEADEMLPEYRAAYGSDWVIWLEDTNGPTEGEEYNRRLKLRLQNMGPDGRLPPDREGA